MTPNRFPSPCVEWEPATTLGKLESTYYWAGILRCSVVGNPVLNLAPMQGVIFSGPPGNGRHTTAEALAGSLRGMKFHYFLRISGCTLDTEDVADACAVIESVNAALHKHEKVCLLLDCLEHSRHCLSIQEYLYQLHTAWRGNLFLILITGDASRISPNLLRQFPLCHFQKPDETTRQRWLMEVLSGNPKKNLVPINIDGGTNHITIARATKDFSWKQMADLCVMMRRTIAFKYLSNPTVYNPSMTPGTDSKLWKEGAIHLASEEVQDLIVMIRNQSVPAVQGAVQFVAAAGTTAVPAAVSAAPAPTGSSTTAPPAETPSMSEEEAKAAAEIHRNPELMSFNVLKDVDDL